MRVGWSLLSGLFLEMVEQIQLLLDDTYNPVVVDSFLDTRRDLSFSLKGGIEDTAK